MNKHEEFAQSDLAPQQPVGDARMVEAGIGSRFLMPIDAIWDARLRVNTFGYKPAVGERGAPDFRVHYTPAPYRKVFKLLQHIDVGEDDIFVDYGCGLGRAVLAASWLGAKRAIGVDIDPQLISRARINRRKSRLRHADIAFVCTPAESYDPKDVTAIYMFHPFGPGTMAKVVERLVMSLDAAPRKVRIAYENPVCAGVIDASPRFRRMDDWPANRADGSPYAAAFWESV